MLKDLIGGRRNPCAPTGPESRSERKQTMRPESNSQNVASSTHPKTPRISSLAFSNSEPFDYRAKFVPANRHSLPTTHQPSTRHSPPSRIARNSLKTKDRVLVYPAHFPSSNSLARLLEFPICGLRGAPAVDEQTIAKRYFVSGIVQGVGFRYFSQGAAVNLGVAGYARNLFDGRVEVYAVGTPKQLKALRSLLERGPRMASVEGVTEEDADVTPQYSSGFSIEYDA
jgi:acylphosphatase